METKKFETCEKVWKGLYMEYVDDNRQHAELTFMNQHFETHQDVLDGIASLIHEIRDKHPDISDDEKKNIISMCSVLAFALCEKFWKELYMEYVDDDLRHAELTFMNQHFATEQDVINGIASLATEIFERHPNMSDADRREILNVMW